MISETKKCPRTAQSGRGHGHHKETVMTTRKLLAILALPTAVALTAAACGSTEGGARSSEPATEPQSEPADNPYYEEYNSSESPAVEEPATTTTTESDYSAASVGLNEWWEWEDGLAAQVTSVERFTPDYDETPNLPDVVVTVTIRNDTNQLYDAFSATMNLYGGPNGMQAEDEFSFYGFDGDIPPGKTATAKWSFSLPEEHLGELLIELAPGWDLDFYEYDPAFFEASA